MKKKKIHFVGIKGVGMTPLAIIAKEAGFIVSGCDVDEDFITDESLQKVGIVPFVGFEPKHVEGMDLIITTGAHVGFENVEVIKAKRLGIGVWTQGQAVGEFMNGKIFGRVFDGISIAGSHGKTTTTAIIATILKEAKLDPSFLIGTGNVFSLGTVGHLGKGKFFVAEADEYATEPKYDKKPKFLWQKPKILVITNIELDHPDLFENIAQLSEAFLSLINNTQGSIIACLDDRQFREIKKKISKNTITYGFSKDSDFVIDKISTKKDGIFFWASNKGISLGEFMLNVTGEHNALNAMSAVITCLELGISIKDIKRGLAQFMGTKRRSEFIRQLEGGALLFDDYAHHPTEIDKTLRAFKQSYPDKKILCIFQQHTYSRTKKLFEHFTNSFYNADEVIFVDIYSSLREKADPTISSKTLRDKLFEMGAKAHYFPKLSDVVEYVASKDYDRNWIILTMGAGDVYKIEDSLI